MANNRMLLINRSVGLGIVIATTFGAGWYQEANKETIQAFFDRVMEECSEAEGWDDFCIGMESCDAASPYVLLDWKGYKAFEKDSRFLRIK